MVESVVDGVDLDDQFLDDLFVAIRDKVPADKWVPIKKDHQRVVAGVKYIIDCGCYGSNFDIALHENMTHFKKISAFQPMFRIDTPFKTRPAGYWTKQDALILENQKRAYKKARRAEKSKYNKELKKKRTYD